MLLLVSLAAAMVAAPAAKPAAPAPSANASTQPAAPAPAEGPRGRDSTAARPAAGAPAAPGTRAAPAASEVPDGPLDFRCDRMQVLTKPNRTICIGNVIFRRGPALVCCEKLEAQANERWEIEKGVCTGDVRAQRGDELVWADRADYAAAPGELVLTGKPLLKRGRSLLGGQRIVARVHEERARIEKPRGTLVQEPGDAASRVPPPQPAGPLPATCPLPRSPRR